jgi:two-component system, cell cycle sensor histidine kinase and response regulator CckA
MPNRPARAGPSEPAAGTPAAGRLPAILLADDDAAVRRVASTILKRHGYVVLEAPDATAALQEFQAAKGRVALVILDQRMPGPDTGATVTALRACDPGARILLMSGFTEPEIDPEILKRLRGFLAKPFRGGELLRAVEAALNDP